jgi:hypothetical protein
MPRSSRVHRRRQVRRACPTPWYWPGIALKILFISHLRRFYYVILYYNRWTTVCMICTVMALQPCSNSGSESSNCDSIPSLALTVSLRIRCSLSSAVIVVSAAFPGKNKKKKVTPSSFQKADIRFVKEALDAALFKT